MLSMLGVRTETNRDKYSAKGPPRLPDNLMVGRAASSRCRGVRDFD